MKRVKKMPKVLVVAPHNEIKNYSFDDWLSRITNLTYKNYDICVADNSKSPANTKKIKRKGINCIWVRPKLKSNQQYIADSMEELRVQALIGKYDFMLVVETDVIPPHDIIERLLIHHKEVVSAMYMIDQGSDSHLMYQKIEPMGINYRSTINMSDGYDIGIVDGQVHEVYACGLGCCMIKKDILEKIQFRWETGADAHPDSFFAADLHMHGIKQYLDTGTLCVHNNISWSTIID